MTQALVTIISTPTPTPAGQNFSHKQIDLVDSAGAKQTQTVDGVTVTTATFPLDALAPGAATITVTDFNDATPPAAIGTPVTATFTIPAPVVNFPATTSVTVTVA